MSNPLAELSRKNRVIRSVVGVFLVAVAVTSLFAIPTLAEFGLMGGLERMFSNPDQFYPSLLFTLLIVSFFSAALVWSNFSGRGFLWPFNQKNKILRTSDFKLPSRAIPVYLFLIVYMLLVVLGLVGTEVTIYDFVGSSFGTVLMIIFFLGSIAFAFLQRRVDIKSNIPLSGHVMRILAWIAILLLAVMVFQHFEPKYLLDLFI